MPRLPSQLGFRRTRAAIAIISALLVVGFAALWVASYLSPFWTQRAIIPNRGPALTMVGGSVIRGKVYLGSQSEMFVDPESHPRHGRWNGGRVHWKFDEVRLDAPAWVAWLGVDWQWSADRAAGLRYRSVTTPIWLLLALSAAAVWLIARPLLRERRRFRQGECPACGYDVRATPDRCPECGLASTGVPAGARAAV